MRQATSDLRARKRESLWPGLHNTALFLFFLRIPYLEYGIRNTIRNTEYGGSVNGGSVAAVKPTILRRMES